MTVVVIVTSTAVSVLVLEVLSPWSGEAVGGDDDVSACLRAWTNTGTGKAAIFSMAATLLPPKTARLFILNILLYWTSKLPV